MRLRIPVTKVTLIDRRVRIEVIVTIKLGECNSIFGPLTLSIIQAVRSVLLIRIHVLVSSLTVILLGGHSGTERLSHLLHVKLLYLRKPFHEELIVLAKFVHVQRVDLTLLPNF